MQYNKSGKIKPATWSYQMTLNFIFLNLISTSPFCKMEELI